jgi:single-strand selective monofunctional uracil DNA glycosylase
MLRVMSAAARSAASGQPGRQLVAISRKLGAACDALRFASPVTHVYNPLLYARGPHEEYLLRHGTGHRPVLLLGMNPGPWGMAQTGVPFGEVAAVRDWLGIRGAVTAPAHQHPKRPVQGLDCRRSEVSGARLWGWARQRFGTPEAFFARFFVWNYCPLAFLLESGANHTPDKLRAAERQQLYELCDQALRQVVAALQVPTVIGVGGFAEERARKALGTGNVTIGTILHPSPASPLANRGWAEQAEKQLSALGIRLD